VLHWFVLVVYETALTIGEIVLAAQEIVRTVCGLVWNVATIFATGEEIVSAAARVVLAVGEVPATVATTSPAAAGVVLGVRWLVLTAETIVLTAATTPTNPAKALKTRGNPLKTVKCCVLLTKSSSPPVPKVDKLF
jgi:hypothetical protein